MFQTTNQVEIVEGHRIVISIALVDFSDAR
jgi:hypothetical protein